MRNRRRSAGSFRPSIQAVNEFPARFAQFAIWHHHDFEDDPQPELDNDARTTQYLLRALRNGDAAVRQQRRTGRIGEDILTTLCAIIPAPYLCQDR
jgi:hypothetical protein